jgi:hypothetical protein
MKDLDPNRRGGYIVPPTEQTTDPGVPVRQPSAWYVRAALIAIATLLTVVFVTATQVRPFADDGTPLRQASHQTLGLPACNFQVWTGMPCPSCGMTTSFAHLVRGNLWYSLRANWVGTGLALFCAALIPWALASALRGRYFWIRSVEAPLAVLVGVFTVTMLVRWGVVLLLTVFD